MRNDVRPRVSGGSSDGPELSPVGDGRVREPLSVSWQYLGDGPMTIVCGGCGEQMPAESTSCANCGRFYNGE